MAGSMMPLMQMLMRAAIMSLKLAAEVKSTNVKTSVKYAGKKTASTCKCLQLGMLWFFITGGDVIPHFDTNTKKEV